MELAEGQQLGLEERSIQIAKSKTMECLFSYMGTGGGGSELKVAILFVRD